jgi:ankyrin repeat protein
LETSVIKSVLEDNKLQLLSLSKKVVTERTIITKLLHLCCTFDSVDCATSLLNGEFGSVPVINEPDSTGLSPLHAAATANAARCVEMLLEKHARTDLESRDGRRLLPLELSLCNTR